MAKGFWGKYIFLFINGIEIIYIAIIKYLIFISIIYDK